MDKGHSLVRSPQIASANHQASYSKMAVEKKKV
jgi:hypothetical protein